MYYNWGFLVLWISALLHQTHEQGARCKLQYHPQVIAIALWNVICLCWGDIEDERLSVLCPQV